MIQETRNCQNCKKDFIIEPDDFAFYEKIKVPAPTFCPECRMQRKMLWRNEMFLYKRKDIYGKNVFSVFHPSVNMKVVDAPEWFSDRWDQNESGREYDFSIPFFEQLKRLLYSAPLPSRSFVQCIDSDYCSNASYLKNCYLVFGSVTAESCIYSNNLNRAKDCLDSSFCTDCELNYESFFNQRCYRALFSTYCEDCVDIILCRECAGCTNCFGCVGLRNKSYNFLNQQLTKAEYEKKLTDMFRGSYNELLKLREDFFRERLKFPVRATRSKKNENCEGEYITNSKNVQKSYYIDGGENLKYCNSVYSKPSKDAYDQFRYGDFSELMYECASCGGHSVNEKFCYAAYSNSMDVQYSYQCFSVSHAFGCVGLHHKQYCILNKQYTKEEYENLVPKIIEHMNNMPYIDSKGREYKYGEFFPPEFSFQPYNQAVAQEYFPLSKQEAVDKGFNWTEIARSEYMPTKSYSDLPDLITEITDDITKEIIACEHDRKCNHACVGVFKILPEELQFYRKMNLPLPRLCSYCRYFERISQRAPLKLWHRKCMKPGCQNEFETSYAPDRPEIVYCETCYNNEVA